MTMSEFLPKLLARVQALPAARPLISRLPEAPAAYLVGGAVRDLLLGGTPFDLDLVVDGDTAPLTAALGGEVREHDRFGTATVVLDGFSYDIARARRETYARPGALPVVEPAPLDDDLRRRDFTVNAIAIPLSGERAGELTAAPDALEDLAAHRLRVLHDGSFIDDPTRLFRLVRYASRLGFEIEPHTRALAEGAIAAGALDTVSGPRIGAELRLLAGEPDPVRALSALADLGLDVAVHSAFGLAGENETLARRALTLLPDDGRPDRLALSVAARGVPATDLSALLDALAFEAEDRDAILLAATRGVDLARALSVARAPSAIAASAAGAPTEVVALAGALGAEEPARAWLDVLRHVRLSIDGRDLLAAGVAEGPAIGHGLRAALAAKLDGRADGREQELAVALAAAGGSGSGGSGAVGGTSG
jgi:tRNA nucleotidyltransferase (CCA-adding enzyme)